MLGNSRVDLLIKTLLSTHTFVYPKLTRTVTPTLPSLCVYGKMFTRVHYSLLIKADYIYMGTNAVYMIAIHIVCCACTFL